VFSMKNEECDKATWAKGEGLGRAGGDVCARPLGVD
jgi:hypothetical protein